MKIYVLGSGGWIPYKNQETACYFVTEKSSMCLLDCGSGAVNISKLENLLKLYDRVTIIFSHYHLDHIIGLFYLKHWLKDKEVLLIGPSGEGYEGGIEHRMNVLFKEGFMSGDINDIASSIKFINYKDGDKLIIDDFCFKFDIQKHSNPSYRITINESLIYATDTDVVKADLKNEKNKILLQECWEYTNISQKHTSFEEILKFSKDHKNLRIGLIHANPFITNEEIRKINEEIKNTNIFFVTDGDEILI